jgi:hypothetical protein
VATELAYPQWQEPLNAAILESDPWSLHCKIEEAEKVIGSRIQDLLSERHSERELRALYEGLAVLRDLRLKRLA